MNKELNLALEPLGINEHIVSDCLEFLNGLQKVTKNNESLDNCIKIFNQLQNTLCKYRSDRDFTYQAYMRKSPTGTYTCIFRHPLIVSGKQGGCKKIHMSLRTKDEGVASSRLEYLNVLLTDKKYWDIDSISIAEELFGKVITEIFYRPVLRNVVNINK